MSKSIKFEPIDYKVLNARQKENFNFQKVAATLADYGFNCIRLSDDWQGADFIACHIDGKTFVKIQLKSCLTFQEKYIGKDIYIAFPQDGKWYLYSHDELLNHKAFDSMKEATAWKEGGAYHWPRIPKKRKGLMDQYAILETADSDS